MSKDVKELEYLTSDTAWYLPIHCADIVLINREEAQKRLKEDFPVLAAHFKRMEKRAKDNVYIQS